MAADSSTVLAFVCCLFIAGDAGCSRADRSAPGPTEAAPVRAAAEPAPPRVPPIAANLASADQKAFRVDEPARVPAERFVGRWKVDMDAAAAEIARSGGVEDGLWMLLMGVVLELRADGTAVLAGIGDEGAGTWHVTGNHAVLDWATSRDSHRLVLNGNGEPQLTNSPDDRGVPLVRVHPRPAIDPKALLGRWRMDVEATVAAHTTVSERLLRLNEKASRERIEPFPTHAQLTETARELVEPDRGAWIDFRADGTGEVDQFGQGSSPMTYTVRDDLVVALVGVHPHQGISLYTVDGGRLVAVGDLIPMVFARE
jgi:hypothetical protein